MQLSMLRVCLAVMRNHALVVCLGQGLISRKPVTPMATIVSGCRMSNHSARASSGIVHAAISLPRRSKYPPGDSTPPVIESISKPRLFQPVQFNSPAPVRLKRALEIPHHTRLHVPEDCAWFASTIISSSPTALRTASTRRTSSFKV